MGRITAPNRRSACSASRLAVNSWATHLLLQHGGLVLRI